MTPDTLDRPALAPIAVRGTIAEAWRLLLANPRQTVLPMLAVQAPVAVIVAVATAVLFLTTFSDEPAENANKLLSDGSRTVVMALLMLTAFEALFAQVARAGTIVGAAAAAGGKHLSLPQTLDPAFTRMGGLIVMTIAFLAVIALAVVTIVGIFLLPYLALRLVLAFEVYMLENIGPMDAFRRSWRLMSGNVLRMLGVLLILTALFLLPLLLISTVGLIEGGSRTTTVLINATAALVQGLLVVPFLALVTTTTTLFYLKAKANLDDRRPA